MVKKHDIRVGLGLIAGFVATLPIPRRFDPWIADRLTALFLRLRPGNVPRTAGVFRQGLGPRAEGVDLEAAARAFYAAKMEHSVGRARGLWPRAWNPVIEVEGREYVDEALEAGHGAILWRIDMGDTMVLQRAAWQSGWPLVQLSSRIHGVTESKVGYRFVAPLYARPENAYLTERVRIPVDWSIGYLPRLIRAVNNNQVVAILGEVVARQNVSAPVLTGSRPLPTGAPAIAHRTGAALIPAATFRIDTMHYRVRFGPPIEVDRTVSRREATERATVEFGRRIGEAAAESPGDWHGWWRLIPRDEAADASDQAAETDESSA